MAVTFNNLGCVRAEQGDFSGAARFLRLSLAIKQLRFGRTHVEVAVALNNLATVLGESGRRKEALVLFTRAMTILTKPLGRDHPSLHPGVSPKPPPCRGQPPQTMSWSRHRIGTIYP